MTAIALIGKTLQVPGAHDAAPELINYHVAATQARFSGELEERLKEGGEYSLKRLPLSLPWGDYQAEVKALNDKHTLWVIHDDRLVFLLADLAGLCPDLRLIWHDDGAGEYHQNLTKLAQKAFDRFEGPKLRLERDDPKAIKDFVTGKAARVMEPEPADEPEPKPKGRGKK